MRKNTYLCGYYGMNNTGDDALMLATAWGAQQHLGAQHFILNSPQTLKMPGFPALPAQLNSNQRFRGENRFRQYACALRSRRVIFGGGSVLHNSHDIGIKRHLIRLSGKKSALALGVGLGPFRDTGAEKVCAKFLHECQFVGVRDQHSFDIAQAIAPTANVKITFDLAPLITQHPLYSPAHTKRRNIAICLCPHERLSGNWAAEKKRLNELAQTIIDVHQHTGRHVTLLDFNGHPSLGDNRVHQELQQLVPGNIINNHIGYNTNPLDVLTLLSQFELVLAMRLHAAVFAFLANTPILSLNYHSKCVGWCEQIKLAQSMQVDSGNIHAANLTPIIINGLNDGFVQPERPIKDAVEAAMKNWRYVDDKNKAYRCNPAL
ncbi:polysaccharide pyruvyl transferase family protein [Teredinibacter purpureus]|uniref:polysaccharide pyruvyl transferase family protein n=1 Tax=Teredinibacter purpureus TaxID=2731756 RepID=UPI0005F7D185|nr:polysaccharide pyruvyl transferase family protein [Teredinibacter purpureus]